MSSDLILKLRTRTQTMRVRVASEKLTDMCQIKDFIEKAWTQLQGKQYRVYYVDEFGEMCVLNDLSLGDAIATVREQAAALDITPVLDLYIQDEGEEVPLSSTAPEENIAQEVDVADTLAQLLDDMDFMDSIDAAEQFVDGLVAANSDLDAILGHLRGENSPIQRRAVPASAPAKSLAAPEKKSTKAVQKAAKPSKEPSTTGEIEASGYEQVGDKAPKQFHVERQVSSAKEASDMMVDLLSKMGFVNSKKDAQDLVAQLTSGPEDLQRVADHIEDLVEGREPTVMDGTAKQFIDMLNDTGAVQDRDAAEDLVGALVDAEQDVDKVFNNFLERTNSKQEQKAIQQPRKSTRRSHRSRRSSRKQQAAQTSA
ncbi:hypothetical protein FOL47_003685 [Perkinsus chesapeaki]|uniref:Uncharacterized protein n=1 Tax=Perkinsus chesapeaki TaxID=330153 RepID=A0A7J6M7V0_PERCH|nr:hypothetical protein FOL47_003685 [Perkinsus chesapeaki]